MHYDSQTLHGHYVSLEPLNQQHLSDIQAAAADGELWKLFFTSVPSVDLAQSWLDTALEAKNQGKAIPFAVRNIDNGKIVGSTRFCNIDKTNRRMEVGYTWYAQSAQRSAINTECKLLLLTQAFELFGCIAVEFRTDWFNRKSQNAIERLGAKRDGVLRNHTIMADGRVRDTVVYSITDNEWPGVKKNLHFMLTEPNIRN